MQRLAKQNQELMEFIAETEDLFLKIESDAELTFSDISGVKGHLSEWCDGLETLNEKKKRIKEEKENEEKEKRKQEDAERRRKEKEEKEAAEKKRKLEEEKKRRNWKTWPPFMYIYCIKLKFYRPRFFVVSTWSIMKPLSQEKKCEVNYTP